VSLRKTNSPLLSVFSLVLPPLASSRITSAPGLGFPARTTVTLMLPVVGRGVISGDSKSTVMVLRAARLTPLTNWAVNETGPLGSPFRDRTACHWFLSWLTAVTGVALGGWPFSGAPG